VCTHLQRRGGRYFLRRAVPADLREHYGKREITRALGTSDRRVAVVLCRRLGLELDEAFRVARNQLPVQPVLSPEIEDVPPPPPAPAITGPSLSDLADKWETERQPDVKSIAATRRAVRRFGEMVGNILPCNITRSHAVTFKDKLLASGQTGVNANKQMTVFNVLLNYAVANGVIEHNPARGVKVMVKRNARDARHPFALPDLQAIFTRLPVYAGGLVPRHIGQDAAYWIPLLALLYGARREELCQLAPDDVYQETYLDEDGATKQTWVLRITDTGEGQTVKNAGSVRRMPLHAELITRGFLDFVDKRRGSPWLFQLAPDRQGRKSRQCLWQMVQPVPAPGLRHYRPQAGIPQLPARL